MTARVRRDAIRDRVRDRRRRVAVLAGLHELLAGGGGAGRRSERAGRDDASSRPRGRAGRRRYNKLVTAAGIVARKDASSDRGARRATLRNTRLSARDGRVLS